MNRPRIRKSLLLSAWFSEPDLRQYLQMRGHHTPLELEALIDAYHAARSLHEQAPPWGDSEHVEIGAPPQGVANRVAQLETQAVQRGWLDKLPHEVVIASLSELRAFQFTVDRPYAGSFRVEPHATLETLGLITLPDQPPAFPLQVSGDGSGLMVSAPGPNLRVQGMALEGQPGFTRLTVDITFGSPFVQVAELDGRMLLKNGYHRAVGLLAQGVTHAPVLLVHCKNYPETGAAGQGFFAPEIVMGEKPPLVKHYLSRYAFEFNAVEMHKAIRLRPDEFQIAIPE